MQPEPSGRGQTAAMVRALADSGLSASDIRHVNAHGTSTPQGDVTEAGSIRRALGDAVADVVVTSTKSMTGHLLGAAGALATVVSTLSVRHRLAPATSNLDDVDDAIGLDVITQEPRPLDDGVVLTNAFGFGGHNVALALRAA